MFLILNLKFWIEKFTSFDILRGRPQSVKEEGGELSPD